MLTNANNKYIGDKFNPEEVSSYLQYLDANNLYGWAMSQLLPTRGYEWVNPSLIMPDNIGLYTNCENEGSLSEVDVRYPTELHNLHNDLPFMCEKMVMNGVKKLVPNLDEKKKYVAHMKVLDQALSHGLALEKVHRVIKFNQSAWLKPYTDLNTQLRTQVRMSSRKISSN